MADWLSQFLPINDKNIVSKVGFDDCNTIRFGNKTITFTTDFLNDNPICIDLGFGSYFDLGRLTVAASISDLCGSGSTPKYVLVGAKMKRGLKTKSFKEFMKGAKYQCDMFNVFIIGGDTKIGKENSFYSVGIGINECEGNFFKYSASPGEIIWISGEIGSISSAIVFLTEANVGNDLMEWAKKILVDPKLPVEKSKFVSENKFGRAGMDVSDGLGVSLHELCKYSSVGCEVNLDKIPVSEKTKFLVNNFEFSLEDLIFSVGGEFQFIVTTKNNDIVSAKMREAGFFEIGTITKNNIKYLIAGEEKKVLPNFGHSDTKYDSIIDEVLNQTKRKND